ncbi:MAG: hypothetical protein WD670_07160 [Actinomycetota bacterium]
MTDETVDERPLVADGPRAARGPRRRWDRRLVPYALVLPGGGWLLAFFLVPLAMTVYTSLQSGGLLLGGFHFTWEFPTTPKRSPAGSLARWWIIMSRVGSAGSSWGQACYS